MLRPVFSTQNASPCSVKLSKVPSAQGSKPVHLPFLVFRLNVLLSSRGRCTQGPLGSYRPVLWGSDRSPGISSVFRLNSPNPLRVYVLIYIDKGLGDMSKFTQQEAVSLLIPPVFPLGRRGIRKQEHLSWEAGGPADCSAGRF